MPLKSLGTIFPSQNVFMFIFLSFMNRKFVGKSILVSFELKERERERIILIYGIEYIIMKRLYAVIHFNDVFANGMVK